MNGWMSDCVPHRIDTHLPSTGRPQATEVVEEVIAQHPGPPVSAFSPGSRLAARAPVHNALTASMRNHFPALTAAQHAPQSVAGFGCGTDTPPMPQVGSKFWVNIPV